MLTCTQLGWAYDSTLGVCGASDQGIGGCLHEATWTEAEARCRQHGARLCTRAELPVNQRSGCGHDAELVWVWEECNHQPAPEYVCSAEGQSCVCTGTVTYGRRTDSNGATITTLAAMNNFTTASSPASGTLMCDNTVFADVAPSLEILLPEKVWEESCLGHLPLDLPKCWKSMLEANKA